MQQLPGAKKVLILQLFVFLSALVYHFYVYVFLQFYKDIILQNSNAFKLFLVSPSR